MRCSPSDLSVSGWVEVLQLLTSQQLSCSAIVKSGNARGSMMRQFERELQYRCGSDYGKVMGSSTESSNSTLMEGSRPSISNAETDARDLGDASVGKYC